MPTPNYFLGTVKKSLLWVTLMCFVIISITVIIFGQVSLYVNTWPKKPLDTSRSKMLNWIMLLIIIYITKRYMYWGMWDHRSWDVCDYKDFSRHDLLLSHYAKLNSYLSKYKVQVFHSNTWILTTCNFVQ